MGKTLFIKMERVEHSLENVLERVRECGGTISELSARTSLDDSFFFVRLSLNGSGSPEHIRDELARLGSIRQVDLLS